MTCTIFKNIFDNEPRFITIDHALERIKSGKSRAKVEDVRNAIDKEKATDLKKSLPSVCFSGKFKSRYDNCMIEHSGFIVLDFDNVEVDTEMVKLQESKYCYAAWVSPSGNGIKVLMRIADGTKHREHFAAIKEFFPTIDPSGVNPSRVCFESYDPNIFVNKEAEIFARTTVTEKIESKEVVYDESEIFKKLLKWIANKGGSFAKGERNTFIFKLASACCRFGISQQSAEYLIICEYPTSNDFTQKEAEATIRSAFKRNSSSAGSAQFDKETLVDKITRKEVDIPQEKVDYTNDIIYGATVKANAMAIHAQGYAKVTGIGVDMLDGLFKAKKGEITCLTGIGNMGKSAWLKWYFLVRILLFGEKFACFSPEDNPPEEYYHDFVEILLGCNCTPFLFNGQQNPENPHPTIYQNAYDFISKHIFYLYPKYKDPTPDYILEVFLETIIKEKVSGICIDPFNRLFHTHSKREDQYLSGVLDMLQRFGQQNDVYNFLVVHPKQLVKQQSGDYPCPDVFDLSGGAMWNNKMDNVIVYHRPFGQTKPNEPIAEFHSKKIKRQKSVGKKGFISMNYNIRTRRFEFAGSDPIHRILAATDMSFNKPVTDYKPQKEEIQSEQMKRFISDFQNNSFNRKDWE